MPAYQQDLANWQYQGIPGNKRQLIDLVAKSLEMDQMIAQQNAATRKNDLSSDFDEQTMQDRVAQEANQTERGALDNRGITNAQADEATFRTSLPPPYAAMPGEQPKPMGPMDILMSGLRTGKVTPDQYYDANTPKQTGPTAYQMEQDRIANDLKERQLAASMSNTAKDNELAAAKYDLSKTKTDAELARKAVDVGEVSAQADEAVHLIDQMIGTKDAKGKQITPKHPGFGGFVGAKGPSSFFGLLNKPVSGTDAAGFSALYDQVKGGAFLEAVQKMKGSGALSDTEGKAASAAISRMNAAQSEQEFIKAAEEFRTAIKNRKGRVIAKQAAGAANMSPVVPSGVVKWGRGPDGKPVKIQ